MGMPSFHQESCAGGFDELESHINVASVSGFSSSGSSRILTVSGATAKNITLLSGKIFTQSSEIILTMYTENC